MACAHCPHCELEKTLAEQAPLVLPKIIALVSLRYHVDTDGIMGHRRDSHSSCAREVAYYLAREGTKLGYSGLSRYFHKSRSAVMSGCGVIERRMSENGQFASEMRRMMEQVRLTRESITR